MQKSIHQTTLVFVLTIFFVGSIWAQNDRNTPTLNLANLKQVAEVEERYQSVNVEMCEVVGGDFWIPYELVDAEKVKAEGFAALKRTIPAVNLYDKKLRTLAAALGPMYIRVSGTWANTTYFQDNDEPKLETAPDGYENVLTRAEWKGVIDFCKATNSKLVTSFAISDGIRDEDGNWTPVQIEPLINFTKSLGGEIYAAEMFNEPSHAGHGGAPEGYDAAWYARDFELFNDFVDSAYPEMKILGPGSTGEGGLIPGGTISTDDIMTATPNPEFQVFTYHYYGGVSQRCRGGLTPENALTKDWLSKTELGLKYYENARNKYQPNAPIWLTETAEAACGGNPWAATYVDCFRYLEQLGRLAKKDVQIVMHNTLCASEYALLEQETHDPRPNYWAAVLWNKFMGTKVYNMETQTDGPDIFIHNLKNSKNGFAVMIVNPEDKETSIEIPANAERYLLTADEILAKSVRLNGELLKLNSNDTLPEIKGEKVKAGEVKIPGQSILFLTFSNNE
ncbi:hypothetical protein [uncultured Draconibacterium sp.]|uniref:hypothetical protein n=1 Tax=uncultured Draconibacterium sp. TaxID=1573823 RepID=UPI002610C213|nr:hypothetical protein [uncultured Draconibacterium sp.]